MKKIVLIHTIEKVAVSFGRELKQYVNKDMKIYNIWDEFLAVQPNETGEFSVENKNRLFRDIKNAEETGADLIAVTCSTLTPHVEEIRPFINTEIVAIDDAMGKQAVTYGKEILIMATAQSTILPTKNKLIKEAKNQRLQVNIDTLTVGESYEALKKNDIKRHDEILIKEAQHLKKYACIVLAQASMAHLEQKISEVTGCKVISSPGLCMEQIKKIIEK